MLFFSLWIPFLRKIRLKSRPCHNHKAVRSFLVLSPSQPIVQTVGALCVYFPVEDY